MTEEIEATPAETVEHAVAAEPPHPAPQQPTGPTYYVRSGNLYFQRFHLDGEGRPNLDYQPVFVVGRDQATPFTDSEEAASVAQKVQQYGRSARLDPEPPKPQPPANEPSKAEHSTP